MDRCGRAGCPLPPWPGADETGAILEAFPDLRVEDVDEARRQLAAVG